MKKVILSGIPMLLLLSFWMGSFMVYTKYQAEISRDMAISLALVESKVELSVKGNIDKMKGLATYVGLSSEIDAEDLNYYIHMVLKGEDNIISNIGVVKDTTTIYLHPYEENKAMYQVDLLTLPLFKEDVLRVKYNYETIITPPSELVQGGKGIIIRLPILDIKGGYWGQIGCMMRYEDFIDSLGIADSKYRYKIVQSNESNNQNYTIYNSEFNEDATVDSVTIDFPGSKWNVYVSNSSPFEGFTLRFWFMTVFGIFISAIAHKVIKELKFKEFMINGLVESSGDIIVILDKNERIVDCSSKIADYLKIDRTALQGKTFERLSKNAVNPQALNDIQTIIRESNEKGQLVLLNSGEEEQYFDIQRLKMKKKQGTIIFGHDVDQMKKQEIATEKARKLAEEAAMTQSRFLANMSHEIRTPINGIMGMLELSMLENIGYEANGFLEVAKDSTRSLLTILNDILDYSKLEVNKMTITVEGFEIRKMIKDLKILFEYTAKEKHVSFVVLIDDQLPIQLFSDVVRLRQVITNLLSNALKFTTEGIVTFRVDVLDQKDGMAKIQFSVRDTGIGIPTDKQKDLFNRFEQLDTSITKIYGGSGLGLAISKGLVELMGGSIKCESKENEGSLFYFELDVPFSNEEHSNKEIMMNAFMKQAKSEKSVLVVDDDLVNRKLMTAIIEKLGHSVNLAKDGREAIEACAAKRFDIVLMDISMPIMGGYEAVKLMRSMNGYKVGETPIIALTAFALDGDKEKCLANGFDDYLSKPIAINDVAGKISQWTF